MIGSLMPMASMLSVARELLPECAMCVTCGVRPRRVHVDPHPDGILVSFECHERREGDPEDVTAGRSVEELRVKLAHRLGAIRDLAKDGSR